MTRSTGRSVFVAALFAVHPLHVESVAWVAERKDVLSTFFGMLTLCSYVLYVQKPSPARYLPVIAFFALGLTAKPMLVTLPFVLLLLDYWPLDRLKRPSKRLNLILEKIPLLILAAISSVITMIVQRGGGAMLERIPFSDRLGNACIVYFTYARKMFWPTDLTLLYPIQPISHWWIAAALALILLSSLAIYEARRRPYIPVGWFWFLGTLVPVIGLVQVGGQALADRYTYFPLIGLFLIIAFAVPEPRAARTIVFVAAGLAIATCIWMTRLQLGYWSNSRVLWEHAVNVTTENSIAHFNLANALADEGRAEDAISHYSEALRVQTTPDFAQAHYNLAVALTKSGQRGAAFAHYSEALRLVREKQAYLEPIEAATAHYNLGLALAGEGKLDEAKEHFTEAIRISPSFPEAHNSLGTYYMLQRQFDKAILHFSEAIRLKPDYAIAHNNLGSAFGNEGRLDEAITQYTEAIRLDPAYEEAHTNLGTVLAKQGKSADLESAGGTAKK